MKSFLGAFQPNVKPIFSKTSLKPLNKRFVLLKTALPTQMKVRIREYAVSTGHWAKGESRKHERPKTVGTVQP
jgi:hypothetical protein